MISASPEDVYPHPEDCRQEDSRTSEQVNRQERRRECSIVQDAEELGSGEWIRSSVQDLARFVTNRDIGMTKNTKTRTHKGQYHITGSGEVIQIGGYGLNERRRSGDTNTQAQ